LGGPNLVVAHVESCGGVARGLARRARMVPHLRGAMGTFAADRSELGADPESAGASTGWRRSST
jgi:hypothetical protein